MRIPLWEPVIGEKEKKYVLDALERGEISGSVGTYVRRFEDEFSRYCDCQYGIAVSSGTTALHLALLGLGIGENDEVLVSTFTNMATFFAVLYQRAKPIPVDIEDDTWNINPSLIESKITRKTKAIIVVHIYGHPANMDPILEIARRHHLFVIEDCAEAHGSTYKGRKVGSIGDVGCFSFYANKIITTGEGGMITTNDSSLAEKARSMSNLSFGKSKKFLHTGIGYKFPLSNLQAALGCAQLEQIESFIEKKRIIARSYDEGFANLSGLQLPVEKEYAKNVYWMYHVVVLERKFGCTRSKLMRLLQDSGIETRESFIPFNDQVAIVRKGLLPRGGCPVASFVGRHGLYLPSGPSLSSQNIRHVIRHVSGASPNERL
jgi:perosamine synthetase